MHTDENKMNFFRRILNMMPDLTVRQAFDLLDAATESFPTDAEPMREDGEWHNGVFFSDKAVYYMKSNLRVSAIKEVYNDNKTPVGLLTGGFALKQAKDAVEKRMAQMDYPWYGYDHE